MDIQFYGANCVTLSYQSVRLVVDDNLSDLGGKSVVKPGDVALFTGDHSAPKNDTKLTIDCPGEYEVSAFSIEGIPARAHMDQQEKSNSTMYRVEAGEIRLLITGHIYPELSDDELEKIGAIDVIIIPVGGNGYTLDPVGALHIIKEIEPKMVIPTHYDTEGLSYPVPQLTLNDAIKALGLEPSMVTTKLKIKPTELSDGLRLIVVERA